jgi:hypothetical protein
MFAAAATVAQMAFDLAVQTAKWLATKVFIVALMATLLPWVLKGFFVWAFEYFQIYGGDILQYFMDSISQVTGGSIDVNIELTGVGGYLATQTGLIDYCTIIFTGWGLYWVISVLSRATRIL